MLRAQPSMLHQVADDRRATVTRWPLPTNRDNIRLRLVRSWYQNWLPRWRRKSCRSRIECFTLFFFVDIYLFSFFSRFVWILKWWKWQRCFEIYNCAEWNFVMCITIVELFSSNYFLSIKFVKFFSIFIFIDIIIPSVLIKNLKWDILKSTFLHTSPMIRIIRKESNKTSSFRLLFI